MTEVRYRADGGSDRVGAVDGFKLSRHGSSWHLAGLRDWSRAMLDAYAEALPPDDRPIRQNPTIWTFKRKRDAPRPANPSDRRSGSRGTRTSRSTSTHP